MIVVYNLNLYYVLNNPIAFLAFAVNPSINFVSLGYPAFAVNPSINVVSLGYPAFTVNRNPSINSLRKYYKMFFLITNIFIDKYYPSIITQFVIGCVFYILLFFIIKDIISVDYINNYKYYALILVIVDFIFIIYKAKTSYDNIQVSSTFIDINPVNAKSNISSKGNSGTNTNTVLSSDKDDFKIVHDLSLSSDFDNSMFSTSNTTDKSTDNSDTLSKEAFDTEESVNSTDISLNLDSVESVSSVVFSVKSDTPSK